ncbi:MAG: RNA 3'-terminal phosphate cyclase [Chloroflexota bacterium]
MGDTGILRLDGSYGEGGGQILRTALALAATLGQPVQLERIRARRHASGLRPQHLAAVRALAAICGAEVEGAALGSQTLTFVPGGPPVAGEYRFDVADARPRAAAPAR